MSTLTVAELRQHLETDFADDALQLLIDDAEKEIIKRHGELNTETDTKTGETLATALFLKRKAESISTVVEEIKSGDGYEETTLSSNDYKLRYGGRQIERLASGDNPRRTWGDVVTIIYTPKDETERRKRVAIDLVKLAAAYNALDSESAGDYKSQSKKYSAERNKLLKQLESWSFA